MCQIWYLYFLKVEILQEDILALDNEFYLTFYAENKLFENKFVFKKLLFVLFIAASTVLSLAESTIEHQEYPEPGNDIKLIIKEENPDTHIIIDFGDGSPKLRTREREVVHQYEKHGVYKPEISLCLGCDSNNIKFPHLVRVFSYVEKPAKLSVTVPEVTLLGTEATIKATSALGIVLVISGKT